MSPQENGARAVRPHHAASVAASAIAQEVRAERGVFGVETKSELEALGFGRTQQIAPTPPWLGQASPVGGRWDQPVQLVGIGDQIDGDDSAVGPPSGRTRRAGGELLVHARRRCKRLDAGARDDGVPPVDVRARLAPVRSVSAEIVQIHSGRSASTRPSLSSPDSCMGRAWERRIGRAAFPLMASALAIDWQRRLWSHAGVAAARRCSCPRAEAPATRGRAARGASWRPEWDPRAFCAAAASRER